MNTSEKLCLQWNDFLGNIGSTIATMREDNEFSDVTLVCEDGNQVEAHKIILSSSSSFFQNLFRRNKQSNLLIFMRGMKSDDLLSVVDFMYYGQAEIYQDNLENFMKIAEELKIKGLQREAKEDKGNSPDISENVNQSSLAGTKHLEIKQEDISQLGNDPSSNTSLVNLKFSSSPQTAVDISNQSKFKELDSQIKSIMTLGKMNGKKTNYMCTVCGKEGVYGLIKNHIEVNHIEGISISCNFCERTFRARPTLKKHIIDHHTMKSVN